MNDGLLERLAAVIASRRGAGQEDSYTRKLLDAGVGRCSKKFGEEAVEVVVAAMEADRGALISETADTLYHLLVLLEERGVSLADVYQELEARMGQSGLTEKASRSHKVP